MASLRGDPVAHGANDELAPDTNGGGKHVTEAVTRVRQSDSSPFDGSHSDAVVPAVKRQRLSRTGPWFRLRSRHVVAAIGLSRMGDLCEHRSFPREPVHRPFLPQPGVKAHIPTRPSEYRGSIVSAMAGVDHLSKPSFLTPTAARVGCPSHPDGGWVLNSKASGLVRPSQLPRRR